MMTETETQNADQTERAPQNAGKSKVLAFGVSIPSAIVVYGILKVIWNIALDFLPATYAFLVIGIIGDIAIVLAAIVGAVWIFRMLRRAKA